MTAEEIAKGLSVRELDLLSYALSCALRDREGFEDAYGAGSVEGRRARDICNKIEALHVKIFGRNSGAKIQRDQIDAMAAVSIYDIHATKDSAS